MRRRLCWIYVQSVPNLIRQIFASHSSARESNKYIYIKKEEEAEEEAEGRGGGTSLDHDDHQKKKRDREGPFCRCRHRRRINSVDRQSNIYLASVRHKMEMKRDAVTLTAGKGGMANSFRMQIQYKRNNNSKMECE